MNNLTEKEEVKIKKMFEQGFVASDISYKLKLKPMSVKTFIKENNITIKKEKFNEELIIKLYKLKISINNISLKFSSTPRTVKKIILKSGLVLRDRVSVEDCRKLAINRGGIFLSDKYITARTNYLWECDKKHQWEALYSKVRGGTWCPTCNTPTILTLEDCHLAAKKKGGEFLSEKYINIKIKYKWKCAKNHIWESAFVNIKSGSWCPECAGNKKGNIEDCYKLAKSKGGYCLDEVYYNNGYLYTWKCEFNHVWKESYSNTKSWKWCPECFPSNRLTIEDCQQTAKEKGGYCLNKKYTTNREKLKWKCKKNHIWEATYMNIRKNSWCPYCSNRAGVTIQACINVAKEKDGYCLSSKYTRCGDEYEWKCHKNHIWKASLNSIKGGSWCPLCKTKTQARIFSIIKNMFPLLEVKNNYKGFDWFLSEKGNRLEIDIFVAGIKLAIEYDGEQHFLPVKFNNYSDEKAKKNLENQIIRDKIKNQQISEHPEDVKCFIRFNYKEKTTEDYVRDKVLKALKEVNITH